MLPPTMNHPFKKPLQWACYFSVLLLLQITNGFSQNTEKQRSVIDSLEHLLTAQQDDSLMILTIGELARTYAPTNNDLAITYYLKGITLCDSLSISEPKAFYKKEKAGLQASLSVTYYVIGDYPKAVKMTLNAIDVFEAYGVKEKLGRCYLIMGVIYKHQKQYVAANEYHRKSYELHRETNDSNGMALALNNIGIAMFDQDSLKKARTYYQEALVIYEKTGDKRGTGVVLINLGSLSKKAKKLEDAVNYFKQSIDIREDISDEQGLIFSYARLGECLLELNEPKTALSFGVKSLEMAKKKEHIRGIRDANELLSKVYHLQGNYQEAYKHQLLYHAAKDSMSDAESIRRVAKSESEFKYRQEILADSIKTGEAQKVMQTELDLQEVLAEKQKQRARFLFIGLGFSFLTLVFVFIQNQKTRKQKAYIEKQKAVVEETLKEITKRDEEKELLLKEIHHRVKNNLQVISSLLELQAKKGDESTQVAFADGQSRVRAMALIHEKLYKNDQIASISFDEYARELAGQIASLHQTKLATIEIEGNGCQFDIDTAVPLGLILNELITNAFKYAFDNSGGKLMITVKAENEHSYSLIVKDNGSGMPKDFDFTKAKSLGLRLVRRLAKQLYGTATYSFESGTAFTITFKDSFQRKLVE